MAKLEQIVTGSIVSGIIGSESVTIVSARWYGSSILEVFYKDSRGNTGSQLLYRESEETLIVEEKNLPWSFDADSDTLRLVSEAYRIHLAHLFDPYLAVHTSSIDPLPHQISAVYQEMLPRLPLRYVLADDPGSGKTIMAGLLIKELIARGDLKRCLIVSPGSLAEQWQDELFRKFHLHFEILTNSRIETSVTGNVFTDIDCMIARLDKLARNDALKEKLRASEWDLVVCDEAHKMSASLLGSEIHYTKRFRLGQLLSEISHHFLLLTATPHNGKEADFQLFLSLVDPDRFGCVARTSQRSVDVSDVMRRLVKEDLLKFDGKPLFPERRAYTVNYSLSDAEAELYDAVTRYVQEEFNRAENLKSEQRVTVGFALTVLQRRLASSPEAIYQSLHRRRERMEHRLAEEELGKHAEQDRAGFDLRELDDDDLTAEEVEKVEALISDRATASETIEELRAEIETLKELESKANAVRMSGTDRKWEELSALLQDGETMFGSDGLREKIIIFTEHRDTLRYLEERISSLLGSTDVVATIHGGLLRDERRKAEELFKQDKRVRILIATDAAGEGINLQRAHLMVNYDLPWNPNRLEQRFGRIHRIGQTEVCHLWNLVAKETREGMVFQRLLEKLEQERESLGGKVFDILGKLTFENSSLRDLLIEAIRYGNDPKVRDRLNQVVDKAFDGKMLQQILAENALTDDVMDVHCVTAIREEMERMEAHKLQPHFIGAFFIEAFQKVGGKIRPREHGRYEILSVPYDVRNRDMQIGYGSPVLQRYERVCFDTEYLTIPGQPLASLLCPGHPLMGATIDFVRERYADVLKRGTIFVDDNDASTDARMLFYIEESIQDGVSVSRGEQRTISRRVHFVEIREDGTALNAGYAPYLDYGAPTEEECKTIRRWLNNQDWLRGDVERLAMNYAVAELVPEHFSKVRTQRIRHVDKVMKAVKERLTAEIQYWDYRAGELEKKEAQGKKNARQNSQMAARCADEAAARLKKRMEQLEQEKLVSVLPPVVIGGALVIPRGLLYELTGHAAGSSDLGAKETKEVELTAMRAVMDIEKGLGFEPKDVSASKCGYDIESHVPEVLRVEATASLRFIEVKGRAKGSDSVVVTKNEILTALNKPDQFILAIVEVDGENTRTIYLKRPFRNAPDFASRAVMYDMAELTSNSEVVYADA